MKSEKGEAILAINKPVQFACYLDKLLEQDALVQVGITSRRQLSILVYEIIAERVEQYQAKYKEMVPYKTTSTTIPRELTDQVDNIMQTFIMNALWLPHKTSLLGAGLRSLMVKQLKEYADLVAIYDISLDDLKRHLERKRRAKGR